VIIEIPGIPIPKARSRTYVKDNIAHHYNSQKEICKNIKNFLFSYVSKMFNSESKKEVLDMTDIAYAEAFDVKLTFFMPIPASFSKKKKENCIDGKQHHTTKPDLDNLVKMYLDCSNSILFSDDKKIVSLSAKKLYSSVPRTIFEIYPIKCKADLHNIGDPALWEKV